MSYSNKIFNVNGVSEEDLFACLKFALSGSSIYGYHIDNINGLEIFMSKSLMPIDDFVIIYESPSSLEEEVPVILKYLQSLKNAINYNNEFDCMVPDIALCEAFQYKLGWRVFVELQEKQEKLWWNHSIWVRSSYVLTSSDNG